MASLARLRPRLPRKLVCAKLHSFVAKIPSAEHACCVLQPVGVRSLQTSADTTTLVDGASHSKPFTVKLHEDSFRAHRTDIPSLDVEVTKDELLGMYKTMQTMRRMEMAADALYKQKLIRGFCHLAIGQVRPHSTRSTSPSSNGRFYRNFTGSRLGRS